MAGPRIGVDCKAYLNTGTLGSPVWLEIPVARDVGFMLGTEAAEARTRGSALDASLPGFITNEWDMEMLYDTVGSTIFALLQAVVLARSTAELAFMDGAIATSGSRGVRCTYVITKCDRNQPLDDSVTVSLAGKPAYGAAFTLVAP